MKRFDKEVFLPRYWQDEKQSTGSLIVIDHTKNSQPTFIKPCVERGDRNNQKNISCVPADTYDLVLEYSPRFDAYLWELKGVPNRSECKVHAINFAKDLNGCIGPGDDLVDMDKDGYFDVTNSRNTLKQFHKALEGLTKTRIHIIDLTLMTE